VHTLDDSQIGHFRFRPSLGMAAGKVFVEPGESIPLGTGEASSIIAGSSAHDTTGLKIVATEIARCLSDDGEFGVLLDRRRHRGRGSCRASRASRFPEWHEICSVFAASGLWIDGYSMSRCLPFCERRLGLRLGLLLPFADVATVVGARIPRHALEMHYSILKAFAEAGEATTICGSGSMSPTFDIGDQIVVEPCGSTRRGEVVLLLGRRHLLIHRVQCVIGNGGSGRILHRGDAIGAMAGLAASWRLLGRIKVIKGMGHP